MKTNLITSTLAALALAATFQTAAFADDPISPVQGAVCNLYSLEVPKGGKEFSEFADKVPQQPAAATFVDTDSNFKTVGKRSDIQSNVGMWTGWLKVEKSSVYTFLCQRGYNGEPNYYRYSIWVNGKSCIVAGYGQTSFNVDLNAGFNSVKIIAGAISYFGYATCPISITYKKAGSVKDPVSFGPADMWYDDEE